MNIELRQHPAQARHPVTKEPLWRDGSPVPLLPNMRAIYLDGKLIGYVGTQPGAPVTLIYQVSEAVRASVQQVVNEQYEQGDKPRAVRMPPEQRPTDIEEEEDDG